MTHSGSVNKFLSEFSRAAVSPLSQAAGSGSEMNSGETQHPFETQDKHRNLTFVQTHWKTLLSTDQQRLADQQSDGSGIPQQQQRKQPEENNDGSTSNSNCNNNNSNNNNNNNDNNNSSSNNNSSNNDNNTSQPEQEKDHQHQVQQRLKQQQLQRQKEQQQQQRQKEQDIRDRLGEHSERHVGKQQQHHQPKKTKPPKPQTTKRKQKQPARQNDDHDNEQDQEMADLRNVREFIAGTPNSEQSKDGQFEYGISRSVKARTTFKSLGKITVVKEYEIFEGGFNYNTTTSVTMNTTVPWDELPINTNYLLKMKDVKIEKNEDSVIPTEDCYNI